MAVPKEGVPDVLWFNPQQQNRELNASAPDVVAFYKELIQYQVNDEVIDTAAFCAASQPAFSDITESDLLNGSWKAKLRENLKAWLYFQICEE